MELANDATARCPFKVLEADKLLSVARIACELNRCIRLHGGPKTIVSDKGTELASRVILEWQNQTGIAWRYIAQGRPQQNGFVKSLNSKLQDEYLSEEMFDSLDDGPMYLRTVTARL